MIKGFLALLLLCGSAHAKAVHTERVNIDRPAPRPRGSVMGRKFYRAIRDLAEKLGCHPQDLLAVLYLESQCNPHAFNKLTSAAGLLQFQPATLKAVGYNGGPYEFQKLSAWEQVPYIANYLTGVAKHYGPLTDITRLYRAVFFPISLTYGDDESTAIMVSGGSTYASNKGLDLDADGVISVKDIRLKFDIITAQTDFDKLVGEMMFEGVVYAPDVIAEVALRYVDVGNTLDIPRYLDVMGAPADRPGLTRYLLSGPSTCALFARGVWRLAGIESGILTALPYRIGRAVSDIVEIAKSHDAWHPFPKELCKGDVILLTSPEHVVVCIGEPETLSPKAWTIDTIEGGQAPNGSFVRRFTRLYHLRDGRLWMGARHVTGRADACAMLPT